MDVLVKKVLEEPQKAWSVRGLAKECNVSPTTSKKRLDELKEKKMIKLKVVGSTYQYKADLSNTLTRQYKILINLEGLMKTGLIEKIVEKNPLSVVLYGSMAEGTNDKKSDFDVLVISPTKTKMSFRSGKETNVLVLTPSEWKETKKKNPVFYEGITYNSIVLYGKKPVIE